MQRLEICQLRILPTELFSEAINWGKVRRYVLFEDPYKFEATPRLGEMYFAESLFTEELKAKISFIAWESE